MLEPKLAADLEKLYETSSEFSKVFDSLEGRRRTAELSVETLQKAQDLQDLGTETSRRRVIVQFFRALSEIHAGEVILGRRGKRTRFRWANGVSVSEVVRAARGQRPPPSSTPSRELSGRDQEAPSVPLSHQFAIRPNFFVHLDLPADLSEDEAERLSTFIRALPFTRTKRSSQQ